MLNYKGKKTTIEPDAFSGLMMSVSQKCVAMGRVGGRVYMPRTQVEELTALRRPPS